MQTPQIASEDGSGTGDDGGVEPDKVTVYSYGPGGGFLSNGFGPCVDHLVAGFGVVGPERNQSSMEHRQFVLVPLRLEPDSGGLLRRSGVVAGIEIRQRHIEEFGDVFC